MMKKLLTCILLILFAVNVNAQWYQRLYGVTNINELNEEQLNIALQLSQQKIKTGKTVTFIGIGSLFLGAVTLTNVSGSDNIIDASGNISAGLFFICGGIVTTAIGIPIWITGSNRKNSIEVALTRFDTSSLYPFKPPKITGMSLTLNF